MGAWPGAPLRVVTEPAAKQASCMATAYGNHSMQVTGSAVRRKQVPKSH